MSKKKLYRSSFSFDKADFQKAQVMLGASGVNLPMPSTANAADFRKQFSSTKDWLSLGSLFGSMNDPKFYTDISQQDLLPKKEDFIEAPFRLISATTVGAGTWKATDFSTAGILKGSMAMLEGKPLYKDHETDLDNWVGLVTGIKWTEGYTDDNGIKVPAGIDGIVAIDAKTNPKVARGVLMGSIFSNSVTVEFDWEMSHEFENEWDFYDRVGKMGADGKMIRRLVKNIHNYHESSLVWLGADPFAKAYNADGSLKHIDTGSIYEFSKINMSRDEEEFKSEDATVRQSLETQNKYIINFAFDKSVISLSQRKKEQPPTPPQNTNKMDEKFIAAFIAVFGKDLNLSEGAKPSVDEMIGYTKKLKFVSDADEQANKAKIDLATKMEGLALEAAKKEDATVTSVDMEAFTKDHTFVKVETLTKLETDVKAVEQLKKDKESLTAKAAVGEKFLTMKKDEAIRLYKLQVGEDKVDTNVVELFKNADDNALDGLLKMHTDKATHKFSGKCGSCGSTDFQFQSTFSGDNEEEEETVDTVAMTSTDLHAKFDKKSIYLNKKDQTQKEE